MRSDGDDAARGAREGASEQNRSTYDDPGTFARESALPHANGWVDVAEQAAVLRVAHLVRGGRILDVGIGTGRTIGLLSLLSAQYVGIDYSPQRVAASRLRFPGLDLRVADARDLTAFDDHSFDLVFFSFNGLDYVQHDERASALTGFHRLLGPGGVLSFSTLNRDGPSHGETPWQLHRPGRRPNLAPRNVVRRVGLNVTDPMRLVRRSRNWRRNQAAVTQGGEWSIAPVAALDFSLLQHFTTLRGLREELATARFEVLAIYESEFLNYTWPATEIPPDATTSTAGGFQVVARPV